MRLKKQPYVTPKLLPGRFIDIPGRGEMFVREHKHADPSVPTVLLLHGWTASSDSNFFAAYETLAANFNVVGIDHRGHGRGMRPNVPFALEDCADDTAAVVRALGIEKVITIGYSMGGPISMLLWNRHPELISGMVLAATSQEWRATRKERARWKVGHALSPLVRRLSTPRIITFFVSKSLKKGHEMTTYVPWLIGEVRRNDQWMISEAGRALSKFDARPFAHTITVPSVVILTTKDQLVMPEKQRQLTEATHSQVVELHGDHFVSFNQPTEFANAIQRAVDLVKAG